ncbi:hypothetical protein [Streptomyces sp. PTY087I2]|uniref:hypothetical protein n=1 Tax=Streptomyces sp. PTY087I2 TaxID=1819298 RepID=UPI00080B5336|nr:hypothetical protein [Streptomyces sp. PTY087I2]OCC08539.1 hypothetical protein A3Q37_05579 [Streptomyces sp. PTY087I2]
MTTDAYRGWDSETRFQRLLDELLPLDMGTWRLPEVRAALDSLGWQVRPVTPGGSPPDLARGRRPEVAWELGGHPQGPRQGVGVLTVAAEDPEQVLGLEINLSYGIAYDDDHSHEFHFAQTAREVTAYALGGPPTRLAGPGLRAVWHRPGTSVAVTLDEGCVILQLLCTDRGAEFRPGQPDLWRGSARADLSPPEPSKPVRDWEDAQARLGSALQALCAEVFEFPGDFSLRLSSARDPLRFAVAAATSYTDALRLETPVGTPGLPDPERLGRLGWDRHDTLWQRTVPGALTMRDPALEAAADLVEAVRTLEVDLSDLVHSGEVSVPTGTRHLELPQLGVPRAVLDEAGQAGA